MTRLAVHMLSDWAVGSGRGVYASTDSVLVRDADGLPFLPAKTLTGLWRDAAEALALALDDRTTGPWHSWLRWTFGDQPGAGQSTSDSGPRPAALSVRAARYPEVLRAHLRSRQALLDAVTVVRSGVAIDASTGSAAEGMLRLEERARAGAVLLADVTIDLEDEDRWPAALLLLGGAALIDHLGGHRRRGAGRCRWDVTFGPWDLASLCERAAAHSPPEPPTARRAEVRSSEVPRPSASVRHGWRTTRLRVRTVSPLLVGVTTRGNSSVSADHIPGATLLPLIASAVPDARALLARAEFFVSDATVVLEGRRALPVPRLLQRLRDEPGDGLRNAFVPLYGAGKVVGLSGYVGPPDSWSDDTVAVGHAEMSTQSHAVINDELQRPTAGSGGLFQNTALAADTVLEFEVTVPDDVDVDLPAVLGSRRLGRSAKDDYGQVEVEVATDEDGFETTADERAGEMVLWLLSDYALPNEQDQEGGIEAAVREGVARALGAEVHEPGDGRPTAFLGVTRRESWQASWGLPRPSLLLASRGSCLRVTLSKPATPEQVWELEHLGVGARRGEGMGRIALLPSESFPLRERRLPLAPAAPPVPADQACVEAAASWDCSDHMKQVAVSAARRVINDAVTVDPASTHREALAAARPWLTEGDVDELLAEVLPPPSRPARGAEHQGELDGR